ncbi:hypothetical protein N7478_005389 [Penicillium angulare]|uniref:uncharacterized protein n=1 Tax=Penicillium angulare TaxID=116970 RepID=UPI00253FAF1F|nr:uncharacterized protein N7478_005389 [Penicillium angulare]KAJ5280017.1 hypothetical protein N7478_005389 [Penicillium angulare]
MKSFSSSAINKSGKKFAPKAPVRRPAPAVAGARRPSATRQAQVQAAQNSQEIPKENVVAEPTPALPSASPAEVEQPAVTEKALPVESRETAKSAPKPTAIPIPLPKRKSPAPTTAPITASQLILTPTPTAPAYTTETDGSTSPRTVPDKPTIVPSIERDVEQAVANEVAFEAAQPAADVGLLNDAPSMPEPSLEFQKTPPIQLKRAKKTSEITKPRSKPRPRGPVATSPATQGTDSTSRQASATPTASGAASSVALSTPEPSQTSINGKKRKASKAGTSGFDGTEKPKKTRRRVKRESTPEDAETVEILPNVIKMSELCKDLKTGRKSKREIELRRIEAEEQERKQKAQNEETPAETPTKADVENADTANKEKKDRLDEGSNNATGPVMRIVNGEIVLDASSLQVDRHADAERDAGDMITVEENQLTRKINQSTYGKRTKTESWDEEMTDLFYRGLRMFGTDFQCISKIFPGRSRRQIKLKFNNEERKDPQRIKDTLFGPRETIDLASLEQMTNVIFDDPQVVQRELDAERVEIEKQHEKEKQLQEEMLRNPTGAGADENAADDQTNAALAKNKKRNAKKKSAGISGGTEEVIGNIDD